MPRLQRPAPRSRRFGQRPKPKWLRTLQAPVARLLPAERVNALLKSRAVRTGAFVVVISLVAGRLFYEINGHSLPAPGYRPSWTDRNVLNSDPGSDAAPVVPALSSPTDLLPSAAGNRWVSSGVTPEGENLTLETTVASASPLPNGGVEAVFTSRFLMRLRPPQLLTERYRLDSEGITGVATGENGDIRLDPPLPLVRFPIQRGAYLNWSGRLVPPSGTPTPATAICRVDGIDTVETPAGTYTAYRLDMQVRVGPAPESQPPRSSTIYLAPGIGFVRQEIGQMPGVTALTLRRFQSSGVSSKRPSQ